MLYILQVESKGRGVFSDIKLSQGSTIEDSPILLIHSLDTPLVEKTNLVNFIYNWKSGESAIGLGYASLYNHSDNPNAEFVKNFDTQMIKIKALRNLNRDEEITIDYRLDDAPLWFENKEK